MAAFARTQVMTSSSGIVDVGDNTEDATSYGKKGSLRLVSFNWIKGECMHKDAIEHGGQLPGKGL